MLGDGLTGSSSADELDRVSFAGWEITLTAHVLAPHLDRQGLTALCPMSHFPMTMGSFVVVVVVCLFVCFL